ncbi:MAG TPA: saccharopine dehydrogenase family protein [Dongiaceae bacterium]|jgi:saccharopine dehydrogenase-like NADP-dependent oxidoreductase|nr:saccharopine dehydrogenase family protein [Dongiaceae bacterium]
MKREVLVLGAGKIGGAIVDLLHATGDYRITLADSDATFLAQAAKEGPAGQKAVAKAVDVSDPKALADLLKGKQAVLSALPFFLNPGVAEGCAAAGVHYFDLTEDVETTRAVRRVAEGSKAAFVPQCGLAPGFISIVAHHLAKKFDSLRTLQMRVGALPQFPANALKYNLTWSTDGLINEYCNPCEAIHDGRMVEMMPMEGLEHFSLDGIDYECFNTSGGLGTLCETLDGKVESLNYKTVRYPGHCAAMKMLLEDLRLRNRRGLLKDIMEQSLPITHQDVVLIFVTATGMREGRLTQESYAKKIYAKALGGKLMSAIQITTAAGICAMLDLHFAGHLPQSGFVRQETCDLDRFLENRFGQHYG